LNLHVPAFHAGGEGRGCLPPVGQSVADTWSHPAVPLTGTVRSQGVDRPFTMELVAFGLSGATSEF